MQRACDGEEEIAAMAEAIRGGDRRALARAITLVESTRPEHRARAEALLARLEQAAPADSVRIGLTGTPGVGKSTFIERFGLSLIAAGHKVAVLAVDPSSARSGGSILGDKTRMPRLSRAPEAYIRPSPSGATLGGVAQRTREAIVLVEAAGFDRVIVETVGVGQSETMVAEMTDVFLLLLAPGGGDELQGVKRGIMEMADIIVINKADGDLAAQAERTRADYAAALRLLRHRPGDPPGFPRVLTVSAIEGRGIDEVQDAIEELVAWRRKAGIFAERRKMQERARFRRALEAGILDAVTGDAILGAEIARLGGEVARGRLRAEQAARRAIAALDARLAASAPASGDAAVEEAAGEDAGKTAPSA